MKISLHMNTRDATDDKQEQARALERDILACKNGDWEAKARLHRIFMPLFISLAKKRTADNAMINKYIDAGKHGLLVATKKYKASIGPDRFQIFALDFIESQMNRTAPQRGFFSRFFSRR